LVLGHYFQIYLKNFAVPFLCLLSTSLTITLAEGILFSQWFLPFLQFQLNNQKNCGSQNLPVGSNFTCSSKSGLINFIFNNPPFFNFLLIITCDFFFNNWTFILVLSSIKVLRDYEQLDFYAFRIFLIHLYRYLNNFIFFQP
jgi:hypothetical protein